MSASRRVLAVCSFLVLVLAGQSAPGLSTHQAAAAKDGSKTAATKGGPGYELVVTFAKPDSFGPQQLARQYPVTKVRALLPSRGIYLFKPTDRDEAMKQGRVKKLAQRITRSRHVRYAETDFATILSDSRYHSWPNGTPKKVGGHKRKFLGQPVGRRLQLEQVHRITRGAGAVVAVLDTGVARRHPVLAKRLLPGYDYVDDDKNPSEVAPGRDSNGNGVADEAHGHGTFVAGMVALVAPEARILPMRVLDSDGSGSAFLVARAVLDSVRAGADVINVSLGADGKAKSRLLNDVIEFALGRDVQVVAAAGNLSTDAGQYPANTGEVLSVSSIELDEDRISDFANWGEWVDVAAPAARVIGPVPGGGYARWAGTSMAAPQVSAQLALLHALGGRDRSRSVEAVLESVRDVSGREIRYGAVDLLESLEEIED